MNAPITWAALQPVGDPDRVPQVAEVFDDARAMAIQLVLDNLAPIIGLMVFFLAVRFGPALLSWYRARNEPRQLGGA